MFCTKLDLALSEYLQQGCRESKDIHKPVSSSSSTHSSTSHNSAASTTKLETTSKKSAIISPAPNIQNSVDNSGGDGRRTKKQQAVLGHTSGAESFHCTHKHFSWIIFTVQLTLFLCLVRWR